MSAIKQSPTSIASFSARHRKSGASSVRTREVAQGLLPSELRRKLRPKLFVWSVELLAAIGFDVARRFVKAWTASLAKRERSSKEPVQEPSMSDGKAPSPVRNPGLNQQDTRRPAKRNSWSPAGFMNLFIGAAKAWVQDRCPQLGAALAYYTVFSLAPLVVVLLGIFGLIYGGSGQARQKILEQLGYYIDPSGVKVFQEIADHAAEPKAGFLAAVIGIVIALFSASGIFGQLQEALNTIWSVKEKPGQGIWGFIRARFLSFSMVGGVCFLLLVSLTVENLLKALHGYLQSIVPGGHYLALAIFYVFDLGIIILLFAMLFRYLPDVKIAWRDVWMGAALTAILFVLGKFLLGLYLGSGAAGSAYGAASSLVTLLLWIFYSTQILLFGAEFTKVYASTYGSRIEPEPHAVKVQRKEVELPST
jgi:membrane protein